MLNKIEFCVCILYVIRQKLFLSPPDEESKMGYEENCAAKPFSVTPWSLLRAVVRSLRALHQRRKTRLILLHLSDAQLKDIGLTRSDIESGKC